MAGAFLKLPSAQRRVLARAAVLRRLPKEHDLRAFTGRMLPVDVAISLHCAALHVPMRREAGRRIAATAMIRGKTVVSRNVADFGFPGLRLLNRWYEKGNGLWRKRFGFPFSCEF